MIFGSSNRRDEHHPVAFALRDRFLIGRVEGIAHQDDLHLIPAEHLDLIDLLLGSGYRHEDAPPNAQFTARIGYSLRMVARTGTHYAALSLLRVEGTDLVVCPADLVRTHHLQVFTLEQHIGAVTVRKVPVALQRSRLQNFRKGMFGFHDVGKHRKIFFTVHRICFCRILSHCML